MPDDMIENFNKCLRFGKELSLLIDEDDERCFEKNMNQMHRSCCQQKLFCRISCARTFCLFNHISDNCLDQRQQTDNKCFTVCCFKNFPMNDVKENSESTHKDHLVSVITGKQ